MSTTTDAVPPNSPNPVRLSAFYSVTPQDSAAFALLAGPTSAALRGTYLRHEGSPAPEIYRLRSGWLASSISTADGGRQITQIHLAGDLVGLPSMGCVEAVETIEALTDAQVEAIGLDKFGQIFRDHARVAAMLFMWAQDERLNLMKQLAQVGRMRASRRVAALLVSLHRRLVLADPDHPLSFIVPLTQQDLADATGMSIVHANRSLKELRSRGLVTWAGGVVTIHDLARLSDFAALPADPRRMTNWV